jgi:hypothetical protein
MGDVLPKLDFVSRENFDAAPTTRDRDIPLLFVRRSGDRRIRKQNVIHSLALSGVRRDRIAAHELAIIFWQYAAIIQGNAPVGMDLFHRDQFAIGDFASVLASAIGLELQPFASGQQKLFRLANRDTFQIFERHRPDAIAGLDEQMLVGDALQFSGIARLETASVAVENQNRIGIVKPLVALLSVSQIHALQCRDR